MADEPENDDQWLYGDGENQTLQPPGEAVNEGNTPNEISLNKQAGQQEHEGIDPSGESGDKDGMVGNEEEPPSNDQENNDNEAEDGELRQNGTGSDKEDEDDEDSDDDVNVVIGDIKSTPSYTHLNIKRGGITTVIGDKNKPVQQTGKFSIEEFEQIGTINGVPSIDYNLDSLEDKPWKKPGADITDYFNYGFNEDTWKAYCERQKRLRVTESGVGIVPLNAVGLPRGPIPIVNDNSKYGTGATVMRPPLTQNKINDAPKVNTIQVMTADRREYSRKPGTFPDTSVPPPPFAEFPPDFSFNAEPEYYGGYEPTQDSQWGEGPNPNWAPTEIKTLVGGPPPTPMGPPPGMVMPPSGGPMMPRRSPPIGRHSPSRERERDRDRERESRSRSEKPRDRERERSHRRERSRSRSRRHRTKSRSPSHRSHKKKKSSRRHDDSD